MTVTNILEATTDAARMFASSDWIMAVSYEYETEHGTVTPTVTREDVRKAFTHGLIVCPTCGDTVEYCSTFLAELAE